MSKIPIGKIRVIQIKSALSLAILLITSTLSGCQSVNLSDLQEILSTSNLPNSAAEFCTQSGGQIQIRTQENLEPFNVCVFPDGSQCVDEAFQSGNCQAGRYFGSQAPDDITAIAAPFCELNGGVWQYRTGAQNDQYGACVFNDNSECEGAAFYRGECRPGETFSSQGPNGPQGPANMANPASQYCEQNGGALQLRLDANGAQYGVCLFADGTECEEWAYYRNECHPGEITSQQTPNGPQGPANMANPASQHCEQNGGTLQLRLDANGGQYGVCLFADGTECEEWAFYRGECRPGKDQPPSGAASQHTYQNTALGFSLDAPAGWTVRETPNMVQFQRQAYTLFIGYWPANQNPPKIRAGMPAGEYKDAGQFSLAGSMFQKRVVMQQGTLSMVDFGHGLNFGPLQLSIWLEGPQGQGKNQAVEIPQEIIAEAEAILNSLSLQP